MLSLLCCALMLYLSIVASMSTDEIIYAQHLLCPKPPRIGRCIEECLTDRECPIPGQMCCSNGCGHTCQTAIDKPKECPNKSYCIDECKDKCSSDHECKDEQKCCFNGICNTCQTPLDKCPTERNGSCGTKAGLLCPSNTTCLFKERFPDAGGQCCANKPIEACFQHKQTGPCKAAFKRYYYNSESRKCESFKWGGCGQNENNFETLQYCYASCEEPLRKLCKLPLVPGKCRAYIPSYGYSAKTWKCEKFIYGGCGGNANRFKTLEECSEHCGNVFEMKPYLTCLLPKDGSRCSATQKKYVYDTKTCRCKIVRGKKCEGKKLFQNKKMCKISCKDMVCLSTVCNQPKDEGKCEKSLIRFFFNKHTCQCEEFFYGGCGGNENKYLTREDCEAVCR